MGVSRQQRATWAMRGKMRSPGTTTGLATGPGPEVLGRDRQRRCERERGGLGGGGIRRLAPGGSVRLAGCDLSVSPRCPAVTCPWPSVRRSPSSRQKAVACERLPAMCDARRQPSAESCAVMRPRGLTRRVTGPSTPSGMRTEERGRPKVAKLAATDKLREYVQDRLAGLISRPDGTKVPGPTVRFIGRRHGPRQDRRWAADDARVGRRRLGRAVLRRPGVVGQHFGDVRAQTTEAGREGRHRRHAVLQRRVYGGNHETMVRRLERGGRWR